MPDVAVASISDSLMLAGDIFGSVFSLFNLFDQKQDDLPSYVRHECFCTELQECRNQQALAYA